MLNYHLRFDYFYLLVHKSQIFSSVAYHANSKETLLDELETYTNEMTVLAPSAWDPSIRLEPPKVLPSVKKRQALNNVYNIYVI